MFYLTAFSSLMKTYMQTKHTQIYENCSYITFLIKAIILGKVGILVFVIPLFYRNLYLEVTRRVAL